MALKAYFQDSFIYVIVDCFGLYLESWNELTASYTSHFKGAMLFPTYNRAMCQLAQIPRPYALRKCLCVVKRNANLLK